jgi:HSP20 family protein
LAPKAVVADGDRRSKKPNRLEDNDMFTFRNGWDPFAAFNVEVNQMLGNFLGPRASVRSSQVRRCPLINAWEDEDRLFAEAELPGLTLNDLEITVLGNELTLHGRRPEPQTEGLTYHVQERATDEFTRVLALPVEVDADKVNATLKNGVLTISLPKAAAHRPRKITVQAS